MKYRLFESLYEHEARALHKAVPHNGRRYGFVDIVDPTRLLSLTSYTTTLPSGLVLGQRFRSRRDGITYVLVQSSATWATVAAGQPVGPLAATAPYVVTNTQASAICFRGCIPTGSTPPASKYFWMQISGIATVPTVSGGSAGNAVKWTGNGAINACSAATDVPIGVLLNATSRTVEILGG